MKSNNFINRKNSYFYSSLFFAVAFITILTVKLIFAWNSPTAGYPNPAGQTLFSDSNNNIGIGTLSPGTKLEVFSTSSDSIFKLSRGPSSSTSTIFKIGTDSAFVIQNQSDNAFAIKSGNIGIGTTNPNEKLTIEGGISVKELQSAPSETSGYGKIYAIGGSGGIDSYTKLLLHMDGNPQTFSYTGSQQSYTVPTGVTSIKVDAKGARGGGGPAGLGARVQTTLPVTPGETLYIYIGDTGNYNGSNTSYNGGGSGGNPSDPVTKGGDGGGASDIRQGGTALANRVVVAGGGGGGPNYAGGNGGQNGSNGGIGGCSSAAGGGAQSAGGSGATGDGAGSSGSLGSGGAGGNSTGGYLGGAGGGGGYYGGGGGCGWNIGGGSGGGGGSSYSAGTGATYTSGYQDGDGEIIITPWFSDSSNYPKSITTNANTTQSSTQSKFGGKSGYFDGDGDYLSVPASGDWNFGTGDFTIDFWQYSSSANPQGFSSFISTATAGTPEISIVRNTNNIALYLIADDGTTIASQDSIATVANSSWQHITLVRSGNTIYGYTNGTQGASWNVTGKSFNASGSPVNIGIWRDNTNYDLTGYIDELRVSKGIARWTSNFTAPTSPYSKTGLFFKTSSGEEIEL